MRTGVVKWFDTGKGYGFILPDEGGDDVFVHIFALRESGLSGLVENQSVRYELGDGRNGRELARGVELA